MSDDDSPRQQWRGTLNGSELNFQSTPKPAARRLARVLCDAQDTLSRLDALLMASSEPVRNGTIVRMAYREAAGWLASIDKLADPLDLALLDLSLTASHGRGRQDLPSTLVREHQNGSLQGIDHSIAEALDLAFLLRRGDPVELPIEVPEALVKPIGVFLPFWAAWPTVRYRNGSDDLTGLRNDVLARYGENGSDAAILQLLAEGARMALRDLAGLHKVSERRSALSVPDPRSRLLRALDILVASLAIAPSDLAGSLKITQLGAIGILRILRAADIVHEVSGQHGFRAFSVKL